MIRRKPPSSRLEKAKRRRWQKAKGLGPTKHQIKAAKDAHEREVIAAVRRACFLRSMGRCENCLIPQYEDQGHLHEIVSRAKTRGMIPERRFNKENCRFICARCHRVAHHLEAAPHA